MGALSTLKISLMPLSKNRGPLLIIQRSAPLKVDARELGKSLPICSRIYFDSDDEEYEEENFAIGGALEKLIWELVEPEPECDDFEDLDQVKKWMKWREENAHRLCIGFPVLADSDDDGQNFYLEYEQVLLFHDKDCDCFRRMKNETELSAI